MGAMIPAGSQSIAAPLRSESAALLIGDDAEKLATLAERLEELIPRIDSFGIESDGDAASLNDLLSGAKVAADGLEKARKSLKEPVLQQGRAIDAMFGPAGEAFKAVAARAKDKLKRFLLDRQEAEARQLAEAARLEADARARAMEAHAASAQAATPEEALDAARAIDAASNALVVARQAAPAVRHTNAVVSSFGKSSLSYRKVVDVVDITLVPREFLEDAYRLDPEPLKRVLKKLAVLGHAFEPSTGIVVSEEPDLRTRPGVQ